jgi:hypothetical protein
MENTEHYRHWASIFLATACRADLGPHFLKVRDGIYVYGRDDIQGRDPTSNCGIIVTQEGVVLIDSGPQPSRFSPYSESRKTAHLSANPLPHQHRNPQ